MIFSIHIPKTAGTSFRKALDARYGDRLALYYGAKDPKTDPRLRVPRFALAGLLPGLEADGVEVLHGHYRYKDVAAAVTHPERQVWTWLREPVERIVSHYYFYRERKVTAALGEEVRTGGLSLEGFAQDRKMRDLQIRYLSGGKVRRFAFVGLSEQFELGLAMLFGGEAPRLAMRYNATVGKQPVADDERARIAELNPRDVALYARAVELVAKRAAKLGPLDVPETPAIEKPGVIARFLGRVA